jgi:hypothetical protein
MHRAVWGLPQAGILANKSLHKQLLPHGYYKCKHTPGLWQDLTHPISFTLVVDDFGVKYVGREHVDHLIKCIKEKYELTEDWTGNLYCGSSCFGIIKHAPLTYQCRGISKSSSKNTSIKCQRNCSIACTLQRRSNTGPKHKPRCLQISPPNYPTKKSRKFNVLSGAFYITHGQLTSPS